VSTANIGGAAVAYFRRLEPIVVERLKAMRKTIRPVTGESAVMYAGRDRDLEMVDKALLLVAANAGLFLFVVFGPYGMAATEQQLGRAPITQLAEAGLGGFGALMWLVLSPVSLLAAALGLVVQVIVEQMPRQFIRAASAAYGGALFGVVIWIFGWTWALNADRAGTETVFQIALVVMALALTRLYMSARRFHEGSHLVRWVRLDELEPGASGWGRLEETKPGLFEVVETSQSRELR
jgi:hypothetical protein